MGLLPRPCHPRSVPPPTDCPCVSEDVDSQAYLHIACVASVSLGFCAFFAEEAKNNNNNKTKQTNKNKKRRRGEGKPHNFEKRPIDIWRFSEFISRQVKYTKHVK